MKKEKEFQEEVQELNRKIEVMEDDIKKERKLQEVEILERNTLFDARQGDMKAKREKLLKEQREEEDAFSKMYSVQELHENTKKEHTEKQKSRLDRISERQKIAFNNYSSTLSKIKDDTEEKIFKYNTQLDEKLFYENLDKQNKIEAKKIETQNNFIEYEKMKHMRKIKEREEIMLEREQHINKVKDVNDELKQKKEASKAAQNKLNKFWSKQVKDIEDRRRNEINDAKHRLSVTLSG